MDTIPQRLLEGARTKARAGPDLWRSLEELAGESGFQQRLADEFPAGAALWQGGAVGRRQFIKLLGASLALAGMVGCARRQREAILPYVRQPEQIVPGKPLHYATVMPLRGYARGILVESHMGRPTKIEGNPDHPFSLGASDAVMQAAIAGLYDPERLQAPLRNGIPDTWARLEVEVAELRSKSVSSDRARVGLLFEPTTSPTLRRQLDALRAQWSGLRLYSHDPLDAPADALPYRALYDFQTADTILAIESDFLEGLPESLRYARDFAARRRIAARGDAAMSRLYVAESGATLAGAMADRREAMAPDAFIDLLRRILNSTTTNEAPPEPGFASHAAADLRASGSRGVVVVGPEQPINAHRLAFAINAALGSVGSAVRYVADPRAALPDVGGLADLVSDARAQRLDALLVLSANPAYTAPAGLDVKGALASIPWTARLGLEHDETSRHCRWSLPEAHFLEAWSDLRAPDGTASIQQPLIEPLYQGRSPHELLSLMLGEQPGSRIDPVMETWRRRYNGGSFAAFWQSGLRRGVIGADIAQVAAPEADPFADAPNDAPPEAATATSLWALFRPDSRVGDGRWASNPWLQEIPKSLSMLVWDNAALFAPATAQRLGLSNNDIVRLSLRGQTVEAPVWIQPGQHPSAVTLHLGYGRETAMTAGGLGFDAYRIRPADSPWNAPGLVVERTGRAYDLVTTQDHHAMRGRHLAMRAELETFRSDPNFLRKQLDEPGPEESLYPRWPDGEYAWGMAIDLNVCTGCQACVAACQAENNIPVVGKEQAKRGREMHWIRVDRYYAGDPSAPETIHQPVPCMHCENAPCEVVCPVAATVHGNDGLNEMVYNRCVGTRYCSNNCPYKVRRFNFLDYRKAEPPRAQSLRALQSNPDVTVRERGVMEKCTYCAQRISQARIAAKKENRRIRDGEIVPACAQACPTEAIVFGDAGDPATRVSALKRSPLNYALLAELNTRPRTTYLARLRNAKGGA